MDVFCRETKKTFIKNGKKLTMKFGRDELRRPLYKVAIEGDPFSCNYFVGRSQLKMAYFCFEDFKRYM